jgi:hypothetical protein
MTNSRIKAQGFFATLTNLGDQEWEAKVSGKDIIYQSELGTIRLCPDSYEAGLKTALGKPTTLNHTDTINGRITAGHVDGDGDPVLKWKVDEATEKMMAKEDWNGGVSLAFFPSKLREDPEGIADYIAIEWEIDALGIGDGSEQPACPTGLCNPQQVRGMVNEYEAGMGGVATAEEIKAKQVLVAAAKAKADAEAAGTKAKEDAATAEAQLKQLTASTTEDTMKVFESLMDSKLKPLAEENETLKKKLEEVSSSDEAGRKFKEEILAQKKIDIVAMLPADTGIDYKSKTLDELLVLKQLADKIKGDTLPPPTGEQVVIPDPKAGAGAGLSPEGWTDAEVREYNLAVKNRYRVKPKK